MVFLAAATALATAAELPCNHLSVPVLVYHRFGPTKADSMTTRTSVFEAQLAVLKREGYAVIPLRQLLDCRTGTRTTLPAKSVVITADDGHKSVYEDMRPLILRDKLPVTLFIYPSAISHASYAMTWEQLHELQQTGLFDVQSHTYWHPNFKQERRRQKPDDYAKFVTMQLQKSKQVLEARMQKPIDVLAWPFGIYDEDLERESAKAGYVAAFTIDAKPSRPGDPMQAIPRYLMVDEMGEKTFMHMLQRASEDK
ncbi:MAG: polysaccharide deacetylase family protein [Burkholderiales bacterium]|nr:polysaccharide deacetylase family protein [Burkholderiales bacterium]